MNLCVVSAKIHPEDIQPNIVVPFADTNGTSAVLDAVKLNLATQGFCPRMVKVQQTYSYDLLFRQLWAEGQPFILVEHDIVPWPGALVELWKCPEPWCGFPYFVHGEIRSYLGCTKFDPKQLGDCPLSGELVEWQVIDKTVEKNLMTQVRLVEHLHGPAVTHLNINHSRMRTHGQINPHFWKIIDG